eukprot:TRINITY_DN2957_c0_g1_i3.p1 TRINITY_DN2957_c0_g1~~TRINITY_DN2957_c0_g1_i3.p1  ORF type:complete len:340 (-),score=83.10 TRINITY_DN2957_c0_g1_i3:794-1813(-)
MPEWVDIHRDTEFYAQIVKVIRSYSSLPIAVAPYLNGARMFNVTPEVIAKRAAILAAESGINLQIWQDSTGADAINVFGANRYTLGDYFASVREALPADAPMWSDNEAFTWGDDLKGGGYHPCTAARFAAQLAASKPYVSRTLNWIQELHFGRVSPLRCPEAARLFASYAAMCGIGGEIAQPAYFWLTLPSSHHSDTEPPSKLTDGVSGDPTDASHAAWVGVQGTAQLVFVVPASGERRLGWVAAHVLAAPAGGVRFPRSLVLEASADGGASWTVLGEWATPTGALAADEVRSEYVVGNDAQLAWGAAPRAGASVRVKLPNDDWALTLLCELEVVLVDE